MIGNIRRLISSGHYKEALSIYTQFHSTKFVPNDFIYPCLLKACGLLESACLGRELHAHVIKLGFHVNVLVATALTSMYMKLHLIDDALKVFDKIPERNVASINSIISGLSQNGRCEEALRALKSIEMEGLRPNSVTLASVLPACGCMQHGLQIHGLAVKLGVELDVYVATAILTVYSNYGEIFSALRVFQFIPDKNVVSYNALISMLLQSGLPRKVIYIFNEMRNYLQEKPSAVTWISVLSACSEISNLCIGEQLHCLLLKYDAAHHDVKVGTAVIDMYSKCGCWHSAHKIFKVMGFRRNLITWNSMIAGLISNGQSALAVELFKQLHLEGLKPDSASWNSMISGCVKLGNGLAAFNFFNEMQLAGVAPCPKAVTSVLAACSALAALQSGKEIHAYTIRTFINCDEAISTSLIDIYMKCGCSAFARKIFDQFDRKPNDPAFWNAMISGYGRNGENNSAFEVFDLMKKEGTMPNSVTFTIILSACGHAGNFGRAWELFRLMTKDYGLRPILKHFGCMVDLLGRAGRLEEAWDLIQEIPEASPSMYASLLGACWCHLDAELGEKVAQRLSVVAPGDPTAFIILSNIHASQGKWKDVEKMRKMMHKKGLKKLPGCSSIEMTTKLPADESSMELL